MSTPGGSQTHHNSILFRAVCNILPQVITVISLLPKFRKLSDDSIKMAADAAKVNINNTGRIAFGMAC